MESFSQIIRKKRKERGLYLRQVAAGTDIDQAIISKFEKGERKPTREQVLRIAKFYGIKQDKLLVTWWSDKVAYDLKNERIASEVLKVAEQKVQYLKKNSNGKNAK